MRLTIQEQSIIRCICNSTVPVDYFDLASVTKLDFPTIEKTLYHMTSTGRVEMSPQGGYSITGQAKTHPLVRQILQESSEERLLLTEAQTYFSAKKVYQLFKRHWPHIFWPPEMIAIFPLTLF